MIDKTQDDAPEAVLAAWRACEARWDDATAHEALIAAAAQYRCFAWAAARYREHAGDPVAERQQERLRKAAMATMLATASARPDERTPSPYRATMALLVVLVLAMVAGLVYVAMLRHH